MDAEQAARKAAMLRKFWAMNNKGHTMLPAVYRDDIVATGEVIAVHAIRDGESKFGPTWFSTVEYRGQLWTVAQSHNEMRDPFMLAAIDFINDFGPMPVTLEGFSAKGGDGYDFAAPPEDYLDALGSGTGEIGGVIPGSFEDQGPDF